jgi:hypothetical protein
MDYDQIQKYLTSLVPPRPAEMQIMEEYAEEHSFPIIGPVAGYACYQMARMINAHSVFELWARATATPQPGSQARWKKTAVGCAPRSLG